MAEDSPPIVTKLDGAIAVIRFNRPAQRNSLSISTLHDLEKVLSTLIPRDDVKVLIFTGTADVFAVINVDDNLGTRGDVRRHQHLHPIIENGRLV